MKHQIAKLVISLICRFGLIQRDTEGTDCSVRRGSMHAWAPAHKRCGEQSFECSVVLTRQCVWKHHGQCKIYTLEKQRGIIRLLWLHTSVLLIRRILQCKSHDVLTHVWLLFSYFMHGHLRTRTTILDSAIASLHVSFEYPQYYNREYTSKNI